MSFRNKILIAGMIVRGIATFGVILYTLVNFTRWIIEDNRIDKEQ